MDKEDVVTKFGLTKEQTTKIEKYIFKMLEFNNHTNIIGKSTLKNVWERHIADCLQLSHFMPEKKSKIFDIGTGGGLPGVPLSIIGYSNVFMVDSVGKKIDFIRDIIKELALSAKTEKKRIEKVNIGKADLVVSRALAPLNKLLFYTTFISNQKTTSLFLKGRNAYKEIEEAKKNFKFSFEIFKSVTSQEGSVLKIKNIQKM